MPALNYTLYARDSSSTPPGARLVGLRPTWVFLKRLADGSDVTPLPVITEIAGGQYRFPYDPLASGEASGQIDLGATVSEPADRYVDVTMYASDALTSTPPLTAQALAAALVPLLPAAAPLDVTALAKAVAAQVPAPVVNVPPVDLSAVRAGLAMVLTDIHGLPTADQIAAAELKALGQRVAAFLAPPTPPARPPVPTPIPGPNLGG